MIATYASAALICAASLLVGRALLAFAGHDSWSWLEPAVGFGTVLTVAGFFARMPGHGTTASVALIALLVLAALAARRPYRAPGALREGLPVALIMVLVLSIPFAVSGRWGLLGEGFNNDLGLHLAWAEWLRSGFGPTPDAGYPLGPHGLAVAVAALPGIGLAQAFIGEIFAIGVLTALTALAALGELGALRRLIAATLIALPYLAASYFAQAAFKEMAEALFVLAFALSLRHPDPPATRERGKAAFLPSPARPRRRHLLLLQLRRARLAARDRGAVEPHRARVAAGAGSAGAGGLLGSAGLGDAGGARRAGGAGGARRGRPVRLRPRL